MHTSHAATCFDPHSFREPHFLLLRWSSPPPATSSASKSQVTAHSSVSATVTPIVRSLKKSHIAASSTASRKSSRNLQENRAKFTSKHPKKAGKESISLQLNSPSPQKRPISARASNETCGYEFLHVIPLIRYHVMCGNRQILRWNCRQEKSHVYLMLDSNRVIDFSPHFKGVIQ